MNVEDLFRIKDDETLRSTIEKLLGDNYEVLSLEDFVTKGRYLEFDRLTVEEVGRSDSCLTCIVKIAFAEVFAKSQGQGKGGGRVDKQCRMTITFDANGVMEVVDSEVV